MTEIQQDIRELDKEQLQQFCLQHAQQAYRAKQISQWLWKKNVSRFDEMKNIPKELQKDLSNSFIINKLKILEVQTSKDKCQKYLLQLFDGNLLEMVLIPAQKRVTVCISSQSGCALGCSFCATAKMGLRRNLSHYEIYEQVFLATELAVEHYGHGISNIVLMGMGEPLCNFNSIVRAIRLLTKDEGLNLSPERITLSTAGLCENIKRLADSNLGIKLAISLHSAIQSKREKIMPIAVANPLSELSAALSYFHSKTKQRIIVEYLLLSHFNDSLEDAKALAIFCKSFPVKVNIIHYNHAENSPFSPSQLQDTQIFIDFLTSKNMLVMERNSRGQDIDAACGQLAGKTGIY
ncbi:MAG: 23S rRNA (adenine(2503)-C(2))-methyltransferase RlmN [Bacteroidales bacterium]|jgi:23S rRNA (adenine2503-C2)-methyltransferase|nr:23S rRNA (adenine(2503)-C(2))-methyltransferase RlmN [Bacteroidales bacterium]